MPTLDDLKNFVGSNADKSKIKRAFKFSTWNRLQQDRSLSSIIEGLRKTKSSEGNQMASSDVSASRNRVEKSVFLTEQGNIVAGGTHTVLNALAAYLRYLEGTARDEWQEYVLAMIRKYFRILFSSYFKFDSLSRLWNICLTSFFIFEFVYPF